jgi:hypothetical protein
MKMSADFRLAQKHVTAVNRENKRHREAVEREDANHATRIAELNKELTPGAARLVAVVQEQDGKAPEIPDLTASVSAEPTPAPIYDHNAQPVAADRKRR